MVRFVCAAFIATLFSCVSGQQKPICVVKILAIYSGDVEQTNYYRCKKYDTVKIANQTLVSFRFLHNIADFVTTFQLSGGRLREVPEAPGRNNLLELVLSHNNVSEIANLSTYIHLIKADLSYNQIETVPELELPNLTHLNLSHNQILQISTGNFDKVKNLKYLNLHNNNLVKIEMCRFNDWIFVNITENGMLERQNVLCKRCWCQLHQLWLRCSPQATVCGNSEEDFMFVTDIAVTSMPRSIPNNNEAQNLIIGVSIASVVFLIALVTATVFVFRKVKGRRRYANGAQSVFAVPQVSHSTEMSHFKEHVATPPIPPKKTVEPTNSVYSMPYDHFPHFKKQ